MLAIHQHQAQHQIHLSYTVVFDPEALEAPEVHLRVRHGGFGFWLPRVLEMGSGMQDLYRSSQPVQVDGGTSEDVTETSEFLGENWNFTRQRVRYTGQGFEMRYLARIGAKEGKATKGFTGIRLGTAEPDLVLALGHSLFLYPTQALDQVTDVTVQIENRTEHPVYTPWIEQNGVYRPRQKGAEGLRELLASTVLLGPAHRRLVQTPSMGDGELTLELVTSDRIPPTRRVQIESGVIDLITRIHGIFRPKEMHRLAVFLVPRDATGYDVMTPRRGHQVTVSIDPATPSRWRHFAKTLTDNFLLNPPYRTSTRTPQDIWMSYGLAHYMAEKSLDWLGLSLFDQRLSETRRRRARAELLPLSKVVPRSIKSAYEVRTYFDTSILALNRLDQQLLATSGGQQDLGDALRRYFAEPQEQAFADVLAEMLPESAHKEALAWLQEPLQVTPDTMTTTDLIVDHTRTEAPIEANQSLRFVHISRHRNFLENCGCKSNQNGGIARLAKTLEQLRQQDPSLLLINGGDAFPVEDGERWPRAMTREETLLGMNLLDQLDFDAINVRLSELIYGTDYFRSATKPYALPYINSDLIQDTEALLPTTQIVERKGLRIGFIGLSMDSADDVDEAVFEDGTFDLERLAREEAVDNALAILESEETDFNVLLCSLKTHELAALLEGRAIDFVLTSTLPNNQDDLAFGDTFFLNGTPVVNSDLGSYGYIVTDLHLAEARPVAAGSRVVQLTESMEESSQVRSQLDDFYQTIAERIETTRYLNLWTHESQTTPWVGAQSCIGCHPTQHRQWFNTPHASAFQTLVKKRRQYYPNCVECHVTGFEQPGGFQMSEGAASPWLGVQCEMCHGPAGRHIASPNQHSLSRAMDAGLCRSCHNSEHSDMNEDNFYDYLAEVIH